MTARHARLVVLAAILVALAPSVPVHAQQEPTPAEVAEVRARAEQGHASAQGSLGGRYLSGRGVPQDFVLAHMWYNLGAFCQACDRIWAAKKFPVE